MKFNVEREHMIQMIPLLISRLLEIYLLSLLFLIKKKLLRKFFSIKHLKQAGIIRLFNRSALFKLLLTETSWSSVVVDI